MPCLRSHHRELRRDPSLARSAFEESLRWDSPTHMAGHIAMRDVEIDDYVIPKGERCGLIFAAANRDPRKWADPDPCGGRELTRARLPSPPFPSTRAASASR